MELSDATLRTLVGDTIYWLLEGTSGTTGREGDGVRPRRGLQINGEDTSTERELIQR